MSRFCPNCGNQLQDNENFCGKCGMNLTAASNPAPTNNYTQMAYENKDSKGNVAMVCGIIGLFIAGIILGIIAIVEANQSKAQNNGVFTSKAKAGFILGIIDIVGGVLFAIMLNS